VRSPRTCCRFVCIPSTEARGRTPLKKVATAEDVATQIAVLASPTLSGHVSGQVLMVEGGMEGRLLNMPGDIVL
jgi:NAD(P)-dependent dehydrogenase (short-subunit alcohol dehydrogenase family)